jgi:hypothetical protein
VRKTGTLHILSACRHTRSSPSLTRQLTNNVCIVASNGHPVSVEMPHADAWSKEARTTRARGTCQQTCLRALIRPSRARRGFACGTTHRPNISSCTSRLVYDPGGNSVGSNGDRSDASSPATLWPVEECGSRRVSRRQPLTLIFPASSPSSSPLPLYSFLFNSDSLLFAHRHVATLHIQDVHVARVRPYATHAKLLSIRTPSLSNIIPPACLDEVKLSISLPQSHRNEDK